MEKTFAVLAERRHEIESYIELIQELEHSILKGIPLIQSDEKCYQISPLQQKILSAGVFLHLYNLVESTVCNLIEDVESIASKGCVSAAHLSSQMKRQWVKSVASTHKELTPEHRLSKAMEMCAHLTGAIPLKIEISKSGGGNWDDSEIEQLAGDIGVKLNVPKEIYQSVKRPLRNDKGALKVVKDLRNGLAHGSLSFAECGEGHSANDLLKLYKTVIDYIEVVVNAFKKYVESKNYLQVA